MSFTWQDDQLWSELPGARALFTTRHGGVSTGPYESLNLGRWTDDEPAAVAENRERVQARAGGRFAYGRQVHGPEVRQLSGPTDEPGEHDGVVTDTPGVAPMVLVADCLPIIVAGGGGVAVLHGGWRGLAGGIVDRGVRALRGLVGAETELAAVIGPGAGPCCYEVSEAVQSAFAHLGPEVRRGRNLDLKMVATRQLAAAGVPQVADAGLCTICDERFFSHRRDHGVTGRQAGVACLS